MLDRKVKVCHITSAHSRYDGRIFMKECTSLAQNGYDVTLVVNDAVEDEVKNGVKIISTKYKPKNRIERFLYSKNILLKKAVDINADIYHFHDPDLLMVGNKLKKRGKKVIFDSHENYTMQIQEKHYIPLVFKNLISKLYNSYETYSVKKYDAVIFPCTINGVNPFDNRAKETVFINNVPIMEDLYNKYTFNKEEGTRAICHVGGLTHNRGITHLIQAAHRAKVRLILGGKFIPEDYYNEVKAMDEFSCVDYRGFVSREEVAKIYNESFVGVCTILNVGQYNRTDNFATKVYEYMSMGLPVIVSDYPYAKKVLEEYNFGIAVDPEDISQISHAIKYFFDNPETARAMGEMGRKAVKELFNWDVEEKKLLKLYGGLIDR